MANNTSNIPLPHTSTDNNLVYTETHTFACMMLPLTHLNNTCTHYMHASTRTQTHLITPHVTYTRQKVLWSSTNKMFHTLQVRHCQQVSWYYGLLPHPTPCTHTTGVSGCYFYYLPLQRTPWNRSKIFHIQRKSRLRVCHINWACITSWGCVLFKLIVQELITVKPLKAPAFIHLNQSPSSRGVRGLSITMTGPIRTRLWSTTGKGVLCDTWTGGTCVLSTCITPTSWSRCCQHTWFR